MYLEKHNVLASSCAKARSHTDFICNDWMFFKRIP